MKRSAELMNGKVVYLAGPYRSRWGLLGRAWNIFLAWRWARRYWRRGYVVFCPHLNTALMDGIRTDREFLDADKHFLIHSDKVILMPGWWRSHGAREEYVYAVRMAKDVGEAVP